MTLPVRNDLDVSTHNSKWWFDVSADAVTWTPIMGVAEQNFAVDDAQFTDDADFDSGGANAQVKMTYGWGGPVVVRRAPTAASATVYDPGQELCRTTAVGKTGSANRLYVRAYEMEENGPRVEAYQGRAAVQWADNGGSHDAPSRATITFTGAGPLSTIAHPDA